MRFSRTSSSQEAPQLAEACREMSERFLNGGRLLAFGRGPYATDAQHVSVEFVHPVIVGKRALPALDLSAMIRPWLDAILPPEDIVMGFGPPEGDPEVWAALDSAHAPRRHDVRSARHRRLLCAADTVTRDPFIHQELVEIFYHTLWETVHVFLEHRELGQDVGASEFLYPFLGTKKQETSAIVERSRRIDSHEGARRHRPRAAPRAEESEHIGATALAIHERLAKGGKLIIFGNGGSATDANDWAIDCVTAFRRPSPHSSHLSLHGARQHHCARQ